MKFGENIRKPVDRNTGKGSYPYHVGLDTVHLMNHSLQLLMVIQDSANVGECPINVKICNFINWHSIKDSFCNVIKKNILINADQVQVINLILGDL